MRSSFILKLWGENANEGTGAHSLTKPGLIKSSFSFMSLVSPGVLSRTDLVQAAYGIILLRTFNYTHQREVRSQNKVAALKMLCLSSCLCHISLPLVYRHSATTTISLVLCQILTVKGDFFWMTGPLYRDTIWFHKLVLHLLFVIYFLRNHQ